MSAYVLLMCYTGWAVDKSLKGYNRPFQTVIKKSRKTKLWQRLRSL